MTWKKKVMSDNEATVIILLSLFLGGPSLALAIYLVTASFNRWNKFRGEANDIRLNQMEAQAALDLKLREWQQTKSLEDLERHRRRLEGELDSLHADQDRDHT